MWRSMLVMSLALLSFDPFANTGWFLGGSQWCFAWQGHTLFCLVSEAEAADHTLSLTAAEEITLTYLTEQENIRRAAQRDEQGQPLPALTKDQVLLRMARQDLTNAARNMDAELQQLIEPLRAVNTTERAKALDTLSPALKARLQQRLAQ